MDAPANLPARVPGAAICHYGNACVLAGFSLWFLVIPAFTIIFDLTDPHLHGPGVPRCAVRWHRSLSPRYERWARDRVQRGLGNNVDAQNVSSTEWPVFGSVFYLWATEALQEAWEQDHSLCPAAPREYARGAVEAAAALLVDPGHAAFVRKRWGPRYLEQENLFYRSLLIAGLTSHHKLLGEKTYSSLLRIQVDSLANELDASRHGLVNDYPGECYPTDVLTSFAVINHADKVLGTDHSAIIGRGKRAFQGALLDQVGLPPYAADTGSGTIYGRSRGCGDSFMLIWLPGLWPEWRTDWYTRYDAHFWQHRWTADGFREFPRDEPNRDWYMDVDSGPVIAGHGIAACAFGVGAARANGRFDHAYSLAAEMLITSCPLLDGTLAGPRALSNAVDAPYLGEAGILFCLTRQPQGGVPITSAARLPAFVYLGLLGYLIIGFGGVTLAIRGVQRWRTRTIPAALPLRRTQLALWISSIAAGVILIGTGQTAIGLIAVLSAQFLPRGEKMRPLARSSVWRRLRRRISPDTPPVS